MTPIVRLLFRALACLPLSTRRTLGRFIGALCGSLPTRSKKIAELQISTFLTDRDSNKIAKKVFVSLGQTAMESINVKPLLNEGLISWKDQKAIEEIKQRTGPTIVLTAHTGNWDLLAAFGAAEGIPFSTVGREARSPAFQEVLAEIRARHGVKTLWRSKSSLAKEIMRELENKNIVAALIDQDTRVASIPIPFFGRAAQSPVTLVRLAKRYNAKLYSAFSVRTGAKRYSAIVEALPTNEDEATILQEYHRRLESLLNKYPEQWVWFHKRWRTLPNGEKLSSSEYIKLLTGDLKK